MPVAKIIIELTDEKATASLIDRAYDAEFFRKAIPEIVWTGKKGDQHFKMGDRYAVTSVTVVA